jgi:hypothetical protein
VVRGKCQCQVSASASAPRSFNAGYIPLLQSAPHLSLPLLTSSPSSLRQTKEGRKEGRKEASSQSSPPVSSPPKTITVSASTTSTRATRLLELYVRSPSVQYCTLSASEVSQEQQIFHSLQWREDTFFSVPRLTSNHHRQLAPGTRVKYAHPCSNMASSSFWLDDPPQTYSLKLQSSSTLALASLPDARPVHTIPYQTPNPKAHGSRRTPTLVITTTLSSTLRCARGSQQSVSVGNCTKVLYRRRLLGPTYLVLAPPAISVHATKPKASRTHSSKLGIEILMLQR